MFWLEILPCGCCVIAWALIALSDGKGALVSCLVPADDPELPALLAEDGADGGARIAALADATGDDRARLAAFTADDEVLRDRATAAWYPPGGEAA